MISIPLYSFRPSDSLQRVYSLEVGFAAAKPALIRACVLAMQLNSVDVRESRLKFSFY